jgi:hypothetical protein
MEICLMDTSPTGDVLRFQVQGGIAQNLSSQVETYHNL